MAAGTTIQHKRKAGAFTGGQLAAGEIGVDTTNGALYFSTDGATVATLTPHAAVTLGASLTDVLSLTGQVLSAVDAGSDKLKAWDESAGKEVYVAIGDGLAMSDTTLTAPTKFALLADVKAYNVAGGTFTSGAWRHRDLNTQQSDADNIVAISSNKFTPIAGDYLCEWTCPGYAVNRMQSRIYNVTAAAAVANSVTQTISAASAGYVNTCNLGIVKFTANGTDEYRIEHYCQTTCATYGFGLESSVSGIDSVFTQVKLTKL